MNTLTNFKKSLFGFSFVATTIIVASLAFVACSSDDGGGSSVVLNAGDVAKWEAPSGAEYFTEYGVVTSNVSISEPEGTGAYKLGREAGAPIDVSAATVFSGNGWYLTGVSGTVKAKDADNVYELTSSDGIVTYELGTSSAFGGAGSSTLVHIKDLGASEAYAGGGNTVDGSKWIALDASNAVKGTNGNVYEVTKDDGTVVYALGTDDPVVSGTSSSALSSTIAKIKDLGAATAVNDAVGVIALAADGWHTRAGSNGVSGTQNHIYSITQAATGVTTYASAGAGSAALTGTATTGATSKFVDLGAIVTGAGISGASTAYTADGWYTTITSGTVYGVAEKAYKVTALDTTVSYKAGAVELVGTTSTAKVEQLSDTVKAQTTGADTAFSGAGWYSTDGTGTVKGVAGKVYKLTAAADGALSFKAGAVELAPNNTALVKIEELGSTNAVGTSEGESPYVLGNWYVFED